MLDYNDLHNVLQKLVDQLRKNVENVPMEQLQTKYRKSYQRLTESIWEAGQQMITAIFDGYLPLPVNEELPDTEEYRGQAKAIEEREKKAGICDRMREALLDRQDLQAFYDEIVDYWEKVFTEAWEPYMNRHCRWVGPQNNRWIYCDVFKAFWKQDPHYSNLGHWIDSDGKRVPVPAYNPTIGPDPGKEVAVNE